jgi:hypothetical protein
MPRRSDGPRCGAPMKPYLWDVYGTTQTPVCARPAGHPGTHHRSAGSEARRRKRARALRLQKRGST